MKPSKQRDKTPGGWGAPQSFPPPSSSGLPPVHRPVEQTWRAAPAQAQCQTRVHGPGMVASKATNASRRASARSRIATRLLKLIILILLVVIHRHGKSLAQKAVLSGHEQGAG